LASQEQIQWLLPDSLTFEYEVDDTRGKIQKAELDQLLTLAAKDLAEIGIPVPKVIEWLVSRGVVPDEWTEIQEKDIAVNAKPDTKERWLSLERVRTALDRFPNEPIVMYESPSAMQPNGKFTRIWNNREDAIKRYVHVNRDIEEHDPEQSSVGNYMFVSAIVAYLLAFTRELTPEESAILIYAQSLLQDEEISDEDIEQLQGMLPGVIPAATIAALLFLLEKSNMAVADSQLNHPRRWNSRLKYFENRGKIEGARPSAKFTWRYGDTIHCGDCRELHMVTKTAYEWQLDGRLPQSSILECKGFHCQCTLTEDNSDN